MSQMRIQVSYHRQDDAFRRAYMEALQQAGADVWNDEIFAWEDDIDTQDMHAEKTTTSNNAASLHGPTCEERDRYEEDAEDDCWNDEPVPWEETIASSYDEVAVPHDDFDVRWDDKGNPVFSSHWGLYTPPSVYIVLLSQVALASRSVTESISWLYKRMADFPLKLFLVVTAGPLEWGDLTADKGWQFLFGAKRIEAPDRQPLSIEEAVRHTCEALCLTPAGEVPVPPAPQPKESVQDLLMRGNALFAQERYTEALPFFEQATQQTPEWFAGWFNLAYTLFKLKRWPVVFAASDHATTLDPTFADAWVILGAALNKLERSEEGLAACERALALESRNAFAWSTKGIALCELTRYDEALAAFDQALFLGYTYAAAWNNKAVVLIDLKRYQEALDAVNHALTFNATIAEFWDTRGEALQVLHRDEEAIPCFDQAIALDPHDGYYWKQKARSLRAVRSTAEAEEAEWRAQELGG